MKLLQRRLRISWVWLVGALVFSAISGYSLATDQFTFPKGRFGSGGKRTVIRRDARLADYWTVVGVHGLFAGVGWVFTFYQSRRGSWFNPI